MHRISAQVHIHHRDRDAAPFATHVFDGAGPQQATELTQGVRAIPVPGHTEGSVVYLVDDTELFTGDSLCWDHERGAMHAFENACWYSWEAQRESLRGLAEYPFERLYSGHGQWSPRADRATMRQHLLRLVDRMS